MKSDGARNAAIEKSQSIYVELVCGHYTTREEILAYSCWAPKGRPWKTYCGKCGAWRAKKPKKKPVTYPDEPLF